MKSEIDTAICKVISESTGEVAQIDSRITSVGGCINEAEVITLADRRRFFVKNNVSCPADMFERESDGLAALGISETIRLPKVIGFGTHFLVLEVIESGKKSQAFIETFGRQLAELHRKSSEQHDGGFGFVADNYLGSTAQPNPWADNWPEFWVTQRMEYQFRLAFRNGFADQRFSSLARILMTRLNGLLSSNEAPSLIHGDLWSGNYLVDEIGNPVLIDPAAYYANREAEFGMTTLFGGFSSRFYEAYNEVWPLADGAEERIVIYRLYHLLNHLNLFGASYLDSCLQIMRQFS